MKLLVIIVTYNAMQWAERCFESLKNSTIVPDVFVVDNGSIDGTQEYIKRHNPEVRFYQSNENLGFGRANNIGLQYALDNDYDYAYLLNQDAWIFPETLSTLIEVSKSHPDYGILSPFQMEANLEHLDGNFKKKTCNWKSSPELLDDLYFHKNRDVIPVSHVMAAHWLITPNCLKKVGGFSPTFPHYGEDNNFEHRAIYKGFKIGIVPASQAVHDRENRAVSKKKQIYQKYIDGLIRMSNPRVRPSRAIIVTFYTALLNLVRLKSVVPVWDFFRTIVRYSQIRNNRKESIQKECVFLIKQ